MPPCNCSSKMSAAEKAAQAQARIERRQATTEARQRIATREASAKNQARANAK